MSLESPSCEVTGDVAGLGQVVARTQCDEVRKCRGAAFGMGVVVVTVGGCVRASPSEDIEVFALVASAGESLGALSRREDALGVLLRGASPGRAHDEDYDADRAEDDDDVGRSHEQAAACPPEA